MTAPARLLSVRLQGFKSFAERTLVEFGPGISAIVGPNGSGKSNLADALRWALGEQGRSLRTRKSEDVIFAGSERRSALGMADVTLILDNADGLLPVDFSVLELGRRLYRSGENDYLLNRQRVRLRDLVDLLDSAHLAENAFLFIGQGMVDQALALRPEERRPLFEEVAGVRRPERRRRKAEDQLAESEANLARVEDIIAELRPQARRLAAQAEQQASRASAAEELAAALVAAAHARWHEAARRVATAGAARDRAAGTADRAMAELTAAEEVAGRLAAELSSGIAQETERRDRHEAVRLRLTDLRLREATLEAETAALERDRRRLAEERDLAESDLVLRRRELAIHPPERDVAAEAALADADRTLGEAVAELGNLEADDQARGEEAAALRRAESSRMAERETTRRRLAEAERLAAAEEERATTLLARRAELEAAASQAAGIAETAIQADREATAAWERARTALATADAARRSAAEHAARLGAELAEMRGRAQVLERRIAEDEERGIARSARRRGGNRVDEGLVVDPALRGAAEAALSDAVRAYVVSTDVIPELVSERGMVVPASDVGGVTTDQGPRDARARVLLDEVAAAGGGRLVDAVRRDPAGAATRLLARAVWLPDIAACLTVRSRLPAGWLAVTRDGSAVVGDMVVRLGSPDGLLDRRAELDRSTVEIDRLAAESAAANGGLEEAIRIATDAAAALEAARVARAAAEADRRSADEGERLASRTLEATIRESAWHEAQRDRLRADADRIRRELDDLGGEQPTDAHPIVDASAAAVWRARIAELRARRDRLASEQASREAGRRDSENRRAAAAAAVALDEQRIAAAERATVELGERIKRLADEREAVAAGLADAVEDERRARSDLDQVRAADVAARERLSSAEAAAQTAREHLRIADERLRAAERADLEARLGLDALREQLLVELAGLGDLGLRALGAEPAAVIPVEGSDGDDASSDGDDGRAFENALEAIAPAWADEVPASDPPTPGRLAHLRRRFHELGAANPFATEEYEALRLRLDTLEAQERDLRAAIAHTRELIDDLNRMIGEQFRSTFRALEAAFDARFRQLFNGGFARLVLTDPEDLSATGVEIMARPPGKKAQALAMLSGGERALTAVALLFAMLEVRPVPFCVLDEVDAALDEANIGRFTSALRDLAERTQFIVITHNRGTIEEADALYGVTVGDDSVSRVISLRLDEAQAIADRDGVNAPVAAG